MAIGEERLISPAFLVQKRCGIEPLPISGLVADVALQSVEDVREPCFFESLLKLQTRCRLANPVGVGVPKFHEFGSVFLARALRAKRAIFLSSYL
jgi:hypothetical protein